VLKIHERFFFRKKEIDSSAESAYPKSCRLILVDAGHQVIAQAFVVSGDMFVADKIIFLRVETVETVDGTHPELLVAIFVDTTDIVIADAAAVMGVESVYDHLVSVETVEPVPGADPDKSPFILVNGFNGAVGQALFQADMFEFEFGRLGGGEKRKEEGSYKETYYIIKETSGVVEHINSNAFLVAAPSLGVKLDKDSRN
jgi:hypothetical protein